MGLIIIFFPYLFLLTFLATAQVPIEELSIAFTEMKSFGVERYDKQITAWKDEAVLIPIVIRKQEVGPEKVSLSVNSLSSLSFRIAKLEYVLADLSAGACGANKVKGKFKEEYFPDRVNYLSDNILILDHELNYFLVKVFIPQNIKRGKHPIQFVFDHSGTTKYLNAEVTVINKKLPDINQLDFKLDFWQFPLSVSRFYQVTPWSQEHMDLLEDQFLHLKKINQKSITTAVFWDLYNGKIRDKEALMIKSIKKEDGSWEYDYSNFEKYVQLGMSCGIDDQISVHNLFPWNLSYFYVDEKTDQIIKFTSPPLSEKYKEFWTPFLHDFSRFLDEKGWLDQVAFLIDERNKDQSIALANYLKEIEPKFKVGYAGKFHADLSEVVDDYALPSNVSLNEVQLNKRKMGNKTTTFYTACWEKQPNMLMMNNYYDFYFLLMLSKARGYDGFLRWAFNSWGGNIMTDARYSDVPSGDAHFFYPYDQPSIRYELLLDALEEVHKVTVLSTNKKIKGLLNQYTDPGLRGNQKARNELVDSMMNQVNQ